MSNYSYYKSGTSERIYGSSNYKSAIRPENLVDFRTNTRFRILSFRFPLLFVMPFILTKWEKFYVNPEVIEIDTSKLEPDIYRILVIHNFQVEDCNPNLDECLAGIFLSRKHNNSWEEAEDHPHECRTIEFLAMVDTRNQSVYFSC